MQEINCCILKLARNLQSKILHSTHLFDFRLLLFLFVVSLFGYLLLIVFLQDTRVRIDSHYPFFAVDDGHIRTVPLMRPSKPRPRVTAGGTRQTLLHEQRLLTLPSEKPLISIPSPVTVAFPYEPHFLKREVKLSTNTQNLQNSISKGFIFLYLMIEGAI